MTTTKTTIVALLCELLETHMIECEKTARPHVVSSFDGSEADFDEISSCASGITLTLSNGRTFHVDVSEG